jgi:hypothetical protein
MRDMADNPPVKYDEWGHLKSRTFPDGSVAGVLERFGPSGDILCGRLNYCRNGNPATGYDRLWWYPTVVDALEALESWDYPKPPADFIRDLHKNPLLPEEL